MSRVYRLHRLDRYLPQERRRFVRIELVFTTLSAFLVLVGAADTTVHVDMIIVGGAGVLFFGPFTVLDVISELLDICRR